MIPYASWTGTRRNRRRLRDHGWRVLLSPAGDMPMRVVLAEGWRYALDNGAWSAHQGRRPLDEARFADALIKAGPGADWTVVPDIVGGGLASLELSTRWIPRVLDATPRALLAVQDGMRPADVRGFLGDRVGIFLGGTTDWKIETIPVWGALAAEVGCWYHVGRVNSMRRIRDCAAAGADSIDGTSASRYCVTTRKLDLARRQISIFLPHGKR